MFRLFKDVVNHVGPENVVHFVTDNASNMVAAGRRLQDEFPSIYWSPCAAHCVNLILSDFGKEHLVKNTVAHASIITKYVYNHCFPLYLMRKYKHPFIVSNTFLLSTMLHVFLSYHHALDI